jgi:hypothetical protein
MSGLNHYMLLGRGNGFSHLGIKSVMEGLSFVPRLTFLDLRSFLTCFETHEQLALALSWLYFLSYNNPGVDGAAALGLRHVSGLQNLQLW